MTALHLPKGIKPSPLWTKRPQASRQAIQKAVAWRPDTVEQPREHPGKRIGKPVGSWIDDLAALRKAIILCWRCQPKFDHKKAHYYKDERFPHVVGKCDGCKEYMNHQTKLYIHESFLGEPGGNTKAGQCWTPL